jgi:hypothetical protein
MKPYCACLIIIGLIINSCKHNAATPDKRALDELVSRYPEMFKTKSVGEYRPVITVFANIDSIKMQLLESQDTFEQIVILSNKTGQVYAIPFPDNDYRSYWQFYGEQAVKGTADRTFNAEMKGVIKTLNLTANLQIRKMFDDLMISLIQANAVTSSDSSQMKDLFGRPFDDDSCSIKPKNSFKQLLSFKNGIASCQYYHTFWEQGNSRLFQLQLSNIQKQKDSYEFVVYRKRCEIKPIYL